MGVAPEGGLIPGTPESPSFANGLVAALEALPWVDPVREHAQIESLLAGAYGRRAEFAAEILGTWRSSIADRALLCHETSTHYKWLVARGVSRRFSIWLHQYKDAKRRGSRHAQIPHNHRYWFSSSVFRGSFEDQTYRVTQRRGSFAELEAVGSRTLREGDTFTIDPTEIHSLRHIEDGTVTLLVEGQVVRHYSDVYDPATHRVTRFHDFEGELGALEQAVEQWLP